MTTPKSHIVFFSSPGIGHLIPTIELGKRIITHHNLKVTIFAVSSNKSKAESELINLENATNPKLLHIVQLPHVDISNKVSQAENIIQKIRAMMHEALTPLRSAIAEMDYRPSALIVDMFGTDAFGVADEFGMLKLTYVTCSAWFVSYIIQCYSPDLGHVDPDKPVKILGCKTVEPENAGFMLVIPSSQTHKEQAKVAQGFLSGEGILINTWKDLEPITLKSLTNDDLLGRVIKKPIYGVGPMVTPPKKPTELKSDALDWLDKQDEDSVIYVSFGSGGLLSAEQTIELAWGLELSGHKFIWVFRPPAHDESGAYFNAGNSWDNPSNYLPDGFLTRVKDVGFLITGWVPQANILAHQSIGGFLSHCGWNSSQESIVYGKPVIAWPLFGEQTLNAAFLSEELGVAVRPRHWPEKGTIWRDEIEAMVRKVMKKEGNLLREKAEQAKQGAEEAWNEDGSSYKSLTKFVEVCENAQFNKFYVAP